MTDIKKSNGQIQLDRESFEETRFDWCNDQRGRVMVLYWGRRGLPQFSWEFAEALQAIQPIVAVSNSNEIYAKFANSFGDHLFPLTTFDTNMGAALAAWRIPLIRNQLKKFLQQRRVHTIIDLMPHIWMPFILPVIKKAGIRYIALLHDADVHPGDWRTWLAHRAMSACLSQADHVVALSEAVAQSWLGQGDERLPKVTTLFHPDLTFSTGATRSRRALSGPVRLAFLGRIMPYKGLSLFVDTVARLKARGVHVICGVFGEGDLGADGPRLASLDAEIVNRWLDEEEIASILARYDVLIASHREASQSGVVAAALGAGLPVIATPVGGLAEQIDHGRTGLVAAAVSAEALADAVSHLVGTENLYAEMCATIQARAEVRSMTRFAREVLKLVHTGTESEAEGIYNPG